MSIVYRVNPQSICYDGAAGTATPPVADGPPAATPPAATPPAATPPAATPPAATPPAATPPAATPPAAAIKPAVKEFIPITNQEDLNTKMADNRRNLQTELEQTKTSMAATEHQLQEVLATQQFSEETSTKLQDTLSQVQAQLRTKEQQAEIDRQTLEGEWQIKFQEEQKRADGAVLTLDNHLMERGWIDALDGGAHSLAVFLDVVRDKTKMVDGAPLVDLPDLDAEGKQVISKFTPTDAVKRMIDLPTMYGGLFKSNMVDGIGGTNATGGVTPGGQKIKLSPETTFDEFKQAIKANPESFGM